MVWRKGNPFTLLVGLQTRTGTMEKSVEISLKKKKKLETEPPYDIAISLVGIHTKETRIERNTCTPRFITALFIIAWTWVQRRCPLEDMCLRNLWYICTMQCYSAIKNNSFESILMRWIKLEPIIPTEVSQNEKHQYSILMHIYGF